MFEKLSSFEENHMKRVKEGLEDLNLFVMEMERTYQALSDNEITEDKRSLLLYRLKTLEQFVSNMNDVVKNTIVVEIDKGTLS